MQYTRFVPIRPRMWAVLSHSKRVAEIALDSKGRFTVTTNHATPEDLDVIQVFIQERRERRKPDKPI